MKHLTFQHPITQVIAQLLYGIVRHPEELIVSEESFMSPKYGPHLGINVLPHMADYAVLCGRGGRQINALKFIVAMMGIRLKVVADIDLKQTFIGQQGKTQPFVPSKTFNEVEAFSLIDGLREKLWDNYKEMATQVIREPEKIHIVIKPSSSSDIPVIEALADVIYPYGVRCGRKLNICKEKPKHINSESQNDRKSTIPSGKRERG